MYKMNEHGMSPRRGHEIGFLERFPSGFVLRNMHSRGCLDKYRKMFWFERNTFHHYQGCSELSQWR